MIAANLKLMPLATQRTRETVSIATKWSTGYRQSCTRPVPFIFMDIQLPQMDGVTACQNIKKLANNANTPVIAVYRTRYDRRAR
ncbi:response regulator [Vibrio chagasii]|nr:response regulator [Vibrio chagasii]